MILYRPITRHTKIHAIERKYKDNFGFAPNLSYPKRFSEKIQWLKLNYRTKEITRGADKVAVRDMVAARVNEDILIPIIGIYKKAEDIDWDSLPEKFVAKINNGCGLNIICTDKAELDKNETLSKLDKWLRPIHNNYWKNYEGNYKKIKPRIIIEEYVGGDRGEIYEYKFMYLSGKLAFIQVPQDRDKDDQFNVKIGYYDEKWNEIPISRVGHALPDVSPRKPQRLDEMVEAARKLSRGFPVCRVDFYEVGGEIKFGELTFTPSNGVAKYRPDMWDERLGSLVKLPRKNVHTLIEWRPFEVHSLRQLLQKISSRISI